MASPDLLASDAERADAVEQLSVHCARGRLSFEEFESRVEAAYAARTHGELARLLMDLPAEETAATRKRQGPARAGPPGVQAFTTRVTLEARPERVHAAVLDSLAPALNRYGYELRQRSDANLVFERRDRPRWVPFAAVFTFPVGLFALGVRETRRLVIAISERKEGGTTLTVYGTAPRAIRKAFAELSG